MSRASNAPCDAGAHRLAALQVVQLFKLPSAMAHGIQILQTADALAGWIPEVHLHVQVPRGGDARELAQDVLGRPPREGLRLHGFRQGHKGLVGLRSRLASLSSILGARRRGALSVGFYGRQRRQTLSVLNLRRRLGLGAARCPVVYEFHNLDHRNAEQEGRVSQATRIRDEEGRLVEGCDALTAISEPLAEDLVEVFGLAEAPRLVPDGVDLERFEFARASRASAGVRGAGTGRPRAVYGGSLHTHKGVDSLLELAASIDLEFELRIVGGHPEARLVELRRRVEEHPVLRRRVVFLGQRPAPTVAEELCSADAILLPSAEVERSERYTSPLKLFEAMATGVPIVAAPSAAHRSVLRDGRTAYLAASASPEDLGRALRRCFEGSEEGAARARGALLEVRRYGWEQRARTILDVFGSLHDPRGR